MYFQERHHTIVEHLADGFIYHARKLRDKAKDYAKEMSYKDWKDAASNVGKAAELLHFFIDDSIDGTQPFENIRSQAQDLLKARDIESLCLYLTKQKRALDDYIWEYYDQKKELIEHLLRPILLSIEFQASTTTHALSHQITVTQKELKSLSLLETFDQRLILPRHKPYVISDGEVDAQRFEIVLYLTVQSKLDGQLYIPGSIKYFGTNKGVSAITLIANHAALNARVIGSNEHESHYIFDLLYNNTSDIKPDVLSTDTHGVNHVNFALLDLFGYTFAPRYAQFGKIIEDMFTVNDTDDKKQMLVLKKPINTQLIEQEWETIQRIIISLQQKTMTQATLVRKLSGYSKNHSLLQALTEYNRLIKAKYILDYIDDASLRGYVQRALNQGEAYHQLRRAIASVNGNKFRGSSDYEIELWNECARLLTNAIIYFNSLILSQLLTYFEEINDDEKIELTKKVSPVAWHNINLNGTYSFSFEQNTLDLAEIMKPLRENSKKQ